MTIVATGSSGRNGNWWIVPGHRQPQRDQAADRRAGGVTVAGDERGQGRGGLRKGRRKWYSWIEQGDEAKKKPGMWVEHMPGRKLEEVF